MYYGRYVARLSVLSCTPLSIPTCTPGDPMLSPPFVLFRVPRAPSQSRRPLRRDLPFQSGSTHTPAKSLATDSIPLSNFFFLPPPARIGSPIPSVIRPQSRISPLRHSTTHPPRTRTHCTIRRTAYVQCLPSRSHPFPILTPVWHAKIRSPDQTSTRFLGPAFSKRSNCRRLVRQPHHAIDSKSLCLSTS